MGLNLVYLVPGATGGTETYARELIPELRNAAPNLRLTSFINREAAASGGPWSELTEAVVVPVNARNRVQWVRGEQQLLPPLAAKAGVEIVHSLANTAPAWGRFTRVVTVHDLNYRIVPEAHLGLMGVGMRVLVPLAVRRAHRVLVDAASTRQDLIDQLHTTADKIDVVPLGLGSGPRVDAEPASALRARLGAGEQAIVLCVSAKRPHKNLGRLIEALSLIPPERRPMLVLAGYPTRHEEGLRRRASGLDLTDSVRFLDWVPDETLEALYAAARCFVFPSLYEGFGLPVLEAMARGVPVACSARGSLAEVAGSAALLFEPESVSQIASAIERLLGDERERERLRAAGRSQAARFTWAATAAGTLAAYEKALAAPR